LIIWLASYQRSGGSILQAFVRQCLGLRSHRVHLVGGLQDVAAHARPGALAADFMVPPTEPWPEFYRRASQSTDTYLVKSHEVPCDDQPAVHILRDGRAATLSYWKYLHSIGHADIGLVPMIEGAHAAAPWSHHIAHWRGGRSRRTMEIRYEELLCGDDGWLQRLADFIGHRGAVRSWHDAAKAIGAVEPDFFTRRKINWDAPPEWDRAADAAFEPRHGWMMDELGYFAGRPGRRLRFTVKSLLRGRLVKTPGKRARGSLVRQSP